MKRRVDQVVKQRQNRGCQRHGGAILGECLWSKLNRREVLEKQQEVPLLGEEPGEKEHAGCHGDR